MRKRRLFSRPSSGADTARRGFVWGGLLLVFLAVFSYLWHQFFLAHSKLVPSQGGIFTEATVGQVKNLSPLQAYPTSLDQDLRQLIFAGLLKYNPTTGQVESGLAEFKVGTDPRTYELTLKPTARFSNGKAVTVQDVIFTFEEVLQNPNFSNFALRESFEYVQMAVIDDRTVEFTLPERNTFFPSLLTVPILPKEAFEGRLIEEVNDPDLPFNKEPIGAGPFQLKNMVSEEDGSTRIFLDRNEYFYGGKPLLEQIVLHAYPTQKHLEVNHSWPTFFSRMRFDALKDWESDLFEEYERKDFILPQYVGFFFNLDKPIVRNLPFRKALWSSFEGHKVMEEDWERTDSPFSFEGVETSYQTSDFVEARRLLRDNGFPYNKQQEIRTSGRGGDAVSIKVITTIQPTQYAYIIQHVARVWEKELDIEVEVEILENEMFVTALRDRDYDVVLFGQDFSQNFDLLSPWHSSQTGKLNLSNLTREDVDGLIDEIRFSGTESDYYALSEKLDDLVPSIIFMTPKYGFLVSKDLFGFESSFGKFWSLSQRFQGVEEWHFAQEKDWDYKGSKIWGFLKWCVGASS